MADQSFPNHLPWPYCFRCRYDTVILLLSSSAIVPTDSRRSASLVLAYPHTCPRP